MANKRYQVVAACALVPVVDISGTHLETLHRGATFEADPEHYRIKHNAESGYIVELGRDETAGVDATGVPLVNEERRDGSEPGSPVDVNPVVAPPVGDEEKSADADKRRAEAKAKLPADGSAPDGRASKDVWVEYAVSKGMDRDEAEKADKADLVAALKS
jgi:hypothetical protein